MVYIIYIYIYIYSQRWFKFQGIQWTSLQNRLNHQLTLRSKSGFVTHVCWLDLMTTDPNVGKHFKQLSILWYLIIIRRLYFFLYMFQHSRDMSRSLQHRSELELKSSRVTCFFFFRSLWHHGINSEPLQNDGYNAYNGYIMDVYHKLIIGIYLQCEPPPSDVNVGLDSPQ